MNESMVAVLGTLLGTGLGIAGSYVTQRASYSREAAERLNAVRRQVYVEWLSRVHVMYEAVKSTWAGAPALPADARFERLQAVAPTDAQAALESLRLVASDGVAVAAAAIWQHLRRDSVAMMGAGNKNDFKSWRESYWSLRRSFIDAVRGELGLRPLDWQHASVGPPWRRPNPS
jgi:hypothetical protein